jgi:hypothetical protein
MLLYKCRQKVQDSTFYSQKIIYINITTLHTARKISNQNFLNLINALISQPPSKIFSVKEIPKLVIGKYKVEF